MSLPVFKNLPANPDIASDIFFGNFQQAIDGDLAVWDQFVKDHADATTAAPFLYVDVAYRFIQRFREGALEANARGFDTLEPLFAVSNSGECCLNASRMGRALVFAPIVRLEPGPGRGRTHCRTPGR